MTPRQELAELNERRAALEARIALGRDLTPATGPDGTLTAADLATIARDPAEYELRRTEVHEALANAAGGTK